MTCDVKPTASWLYFLIRRLFQLAAFFIVKQEVIGLENVPREGAFVLVVNHLSIFEPPLLFVNFPRQMVVFVADKWRKTPGMAQLVNAVGAVWVARGEADASAIKASLAHLRAGRPLGLAPEGTRSRAGGLQKGKPGAAYLADRAGVPILPVGIAGTEDVGRNLKRLRRTPVRMAVGRPFRLPSDGRAKTDRLEEYTDLIMCRIAALLPPEYRGVYAEHPLLRELLEVQA